MFVNQGQLEHLLRPEYYSSEAFWLDEVENLFRKSWQFAGCLSEMPMHGDYLARDIAGIPVVFKNFDGKVTAFRNICPHRHSMLVREGKGSSTKLKCLSHGWEYGDDGRLTYLPDGISFKGIKAADFCLQPVRMEILGSMIFANLDPSALGLRESLGDLAPELEEYYGNHDLIWHWVTEHKTNWKVIEENAVESYHVPMAHPKTFKDYKKPDLHDHRLTSSYTRYGDLEPWGSGLVDRGFHILSKFFLPKPNYERFKHTHIFPNNLLYYGELFSTWAAVYPITPELTRYEIVGFTPRNLRNGLLQRFVLKRVIRPLVKMFGRILLEDMEVWPKLNKGLANSQFKGVLSCREERVFAFQQYICNNMPAHWRH